MKTKNKIGARKALSLVGVLTQIVLGAPASTLGFKPVVNYSVGTTPRAVAVSDFNGDGKMDLAVANFGDPSANDDGSVSILLGNGDGTYQKARSFAAGKNPCPAYPCGMAVGDFNGDGKVDIAVPNSANAVSVLLGNGDGTYQANLEVAAGSMPVSVVANDLNGDGRPDLVVANFGDRSVGVLVGHGDGTFQTRVDYPTGDNPRAVAIADLNNDGRLDVVVAIGSKGIETFFGNGDGTLQSGVVCACGASSGPGLQSVSADGLVAIADFNGDGKLDLAPAYHHLKFLHPDFYDVPVLTGSGDGTFETPINTGLTLGASPPPSPAAFDFDGDGHADLAVAFPGFVDVFPGHGDGTLAQPPVSFAVGSGVQAYTDGIAVADLDNNKTPDMVVTNAVDNTISVLLNTASTDFSIAATAPVPGRLTVGQSATSTISLSLLNAFDNPVSLACSVQPALPGAPTCSLSSHLVTFDARGNAAAMITINASSSAAALESFRSGERSSKAGFWMPVAGLAFFGTVFGVTFPKKRTESGFLTGAFLFCGVIILVACGGESNRGPKSMAYTIAVSGTSGTTQHSTTLNLTVQ